MNIQIIISEGETEFLRGNYLTWESAQEGLGKLQRAYEAEQAKSEDIADAQEKGE